MARPPGSLATARMNAPVLPSSSQSRMNSPFPGGLLMTTSSASMATTTSSLAGNQGIPGTVPAVAGGMLRPPMMPGLGQPQFGVPPNMAASATTTSQSSIATGQTNTLATGQQQAVPVTNVVPSNINTVTPLPGQQAGLPGQQAGFMTAGPGGQVLKNTPMMVQQGNEND